MKISLGKRWEDFVADVVEQGRYESSTDVVREGLRLVEEREVGLASLRQAIDEGISRGGRNDSDAVRRHIDAVLDELETAEPA